MIRNRFLLSAVIVGCAACSATVPPVVERSAPGPRPAQLDCAKYRGTPAPTAITPARATGVAAAPPVTVAVNATGAVCAKIRVSTLGTVTDVKVLESTSEGFAALAADELRRTQYKPALRDSVPVEWETVTAFAGTIDRRPASR